MDTVKRINDYNDKTRIQHTPVVVQKKRNEAVTILYVVVGITIQDIDFINLNKTLPNSVYTELKSQQIIKEDIEVVDCLAFGDLNDYRGYSNLVYRFPLRRIDIINKKEHQYRLYTTTIEYQKEYMTSLNLCPTAERSWKSVIEKVGKPNGVVLKIKIKNT